MNPEEKQFAVIGLGRFGMALCEELSSHGAQVLAIDIHEPSVKKAADITTQAVVADCSDEQTVAELELHDYDIAMVSIGDDVNASILTTLVLKEAGVRAVWVKAKDKHHAKILHKIGADKVIMPEREMGIRIACNMLDSRIFDVLDLGSGMAIAEVIVSHSHLGKAISEHPCCQGRELTLLAVKRGPEIFKDLPVDTPLETGDILIVAGPEVQLIKQLKRL